MLTAKNQITNDELEGMIKNSLILITKSADPRPYIKQHDIIICENLDTELLINMSDAEFAKILIAASITDAIKIALHHKCRAITFVEVTLSVEDKNLLIGTNYTALQTVNVQAGL